MRYLDADREMLSIIEALSSLNRTGLYSAFYDYAPHVGTLTVKIYEGRWTCFKKPALKAAIDCRRFPLRDNDTEESLHFKALRLERNVFCPLSCKNGRWTKANISTWSGINPK